LRRLPKLRERPNSKEETQMLRMTWIYRIAFLAALLLAAGAGQKWG
jgi:hypothetical protein